MYSDVAVHFTGTVTKEPELKIKNGTSVLYFQVSVFNGVKKKNGTYGYDLFNCSTTQAETAEYMYAYLQEGTIVEINGCLILQEHKDKNNTSHCEGRVAVLHMLLRGGRKKRAENQKENNSVEKEDVIPQL